MIEKKIHQTFETKDLPFGMAKSTESWKQKNPGYEYKFYDKNDRVDFIKQHFGREVLDAYHTLVPGAFKADLFRLCVLYIEGGVYVDSDMICLVPVDTFIKDTHRFVISRDDPMAAKWLANGFMAVEKGHPVLQMAINKIVEKCIHKELEFYLDYTGPALIGKTMNEYLGKGIEDDFELGDIGDGIFLLKHDIGKRMTMGRMAVICTEYDTYRQEMEGMGNKKFYDYVQAETIFNKIPRKIIYTTKDILDVNQYMIDSFTKHNPDWELLYFNDDAVNEWFANSIYNDAYKQLTEKGERTDFFRYCYLYENGGVYVDADTMCHRPLDEIIDGRELIVGLEACLPADDKLFREVGYQTGKNLVSVANWTIMSAPKQPVISRLINDIINNKDKRGVLFNTGPHRFTRHIIDYIGVDHDFTQDIDYEKTTLLSINRFGSNQSHSNAIAHNPLTNKNVDKTIYISHLFDGSWRDSTPREDMKKFKTEFCSHNLSMWKTDDGFKGIARLDQDTSRTRFMEELGDCRYLYEFDFDNQVNKIGAREEKIKYNELSKWEDYRTVVYQGKPYHFASFIDKDWNTETAILDENYNVVKELKFDEPNTMSFVAGKEVTWYKNLLPFIHNDELHFIYNTSPNYKVYKHVGNWEFEKIIDVPNHLHSKFPQDELYFTEACKVGGSTAPIWFEDEQCYIYVVHTKLYSKRAYNHYAIKLDKDLNIIDIGYKPFISKSQPYALFFVTTMLDNGKYVLLAGGLEDNTNWTWNIPKSLLFKTFK